MVWGPHTVDSRAHNPVCKIARKKMQSFEVANEYTLFNSLRSHCWELCSCSWAEVSLMQGCWLATASNIYQVTDGNLQRVCREVSCLPLVLGEARQHCKTQIHKYTRLSFRVGLLTHFKQVKWGQFKEITVFLKVKLAHFYCRHFRQYR